MSKRRDLFGLLGAALGALGLSGCAGAPRVEAHAASAPPAVYAEAPAAVAKHEARSALEYHDESESDRAFIANAERAIEEYSQFLARAGDAAEYASAVARSREQIEDLHAAIDFVRAGAAQRAAH